MTKALRRLEHKSTREATCWGIGTTINLIHQQSHQASLSSQESPVTKQLYSITMDSFQQNNTTSSAPKEDYLDKGETPQDFAGRTLLTTSRPRLS